MNLNITRPIVFLDLETTGTDLVADRVVQICLLKMLPDSSEEARTRLINPGIPIPKEATDIHGITGADVKDQPRFRDIANALYDFLGGCDLAGYNSNAFDIPFLVEEFARCGIEFPQEGTRLIDVCTIFKRKEERTLSAAYKFYCGKILEHAHNAEADVRATYEVFRAQQERYNDIGALTIEQLHTFCLPGNMVDFARYLVRNNKGEIVFNFGKYKGKPVAQHPDYARWMLENDFPEGTKRVLRKVVTSLPSP